MDFSTINYLAVLVAALSTFILGGLWYSPMLFGKAWMRANNSAKLIYKPLARRECLAGHLCFLW